MVRATPAAQIDGCHQQALVIDQMLDLLFESVQQEMVHLKNVEAADVSGGLSNEEKASRQRHNHITHPEPMEAGQVRRNRTFLVCKSNACQCAGTSAIISVGPPLHIRRSKAYRCMTEGRWYPADPEGARCYVCNIEACQLSNSPHHIIYGHSGSPLLRRRRFSIWLGLTQS